jgi:ribonuclease-3
VLQALADEIDDTCRPNWRPYNPKTELQELLQSLGQSPPTYHVVDTSGSPHEPRYTVEVVGNAGVLAVGAGRSKNAAETAAAEAALATLAE